MCAILLILLALTTPAWVAAQIPDGGEFQVNTYTTDGQYAPKVAPDGASGFVVTWDSYGSSGTDTEALSIQGQRYASDGSPAGSEFQVNTYTTSYQFGSAVSSDGAGGFVVIWESDGSSGTDSDGHSIQGQRFASDGSPAGSEFQVNTYTTSGQDRPEVAPDGAGGFIVVWRSTGSSGTDSDGRSIQGQRFASDGSPAGSEFQVNTYTTGFQNQPAVGPDGAGGFVVTWESDGSSGNDSDGRSIQGQRFAADGSPAGSEFQVNTYTTSWQESPAVGPDGVGGFVVTWESYGSSGTDSDVASVQGQRFASDGSPAGSEFQVNTYTTSGQYQPEVAPDGAGGFVVVWDSYGSSGTDSSEESSHGQRFASDGSPIGSEFQINTYTSGSQNTPVVVPNGTDGFVVVWTSFGSSGTDSDVASIQGQRYLTPEIFEDGFESGDTSAWSQAVP